MILGLAQCHEQDRPSRFAYCAVFLRVMIYSLPWGTWLLGAF
jgi:hypothetical protein